MKIQQGFADLLQQMIDGHQPGYGLFQGSNRKMLEQFINDGVLDYIPIGTQQKKIFCPDHNNLRSYLHNKYGIPSLENYIVFLDSENTSRSDAVKATSNSKFKNVKLFEGFLVNAYTEIQCQLNGKDFLVKPEQGTFIFINDYKNFSIPEDITVVGVEGFENFRDIQRQQYLFKDIKPLFLWRYQNSTSIANWLKLIPNNYLHFGDYDPKGLHIYLAEFADKIGVDRCRFLVPENLETLMIESGEKVLYEDQVDKLKNFDFSEFENVHDVYKIITKYKKGLAQEVLIQ
ncbi:MAG TPA: hypothetical protein VIM65_05715 [Cyclobacteriaceae bacterium]